MTDQPRRLRVLGFVVQPQLVWDDGDSLTAGPQLEPLTVSAGELADFPAKWQESFDKLRDDAENPPD